MIRDYLKDLRLLKIPFQSKSLFYELMDKKRIKKKNENSQELATT